MTKKLFLLLALVLLAASLTATADDLASLDAPALADATVVELEVAPTCIAALAAPDGTTVDLFPAPVFSKDGCSSSSCDLSCRAQGYDYGVCFQTFCICRFWLP